MRIDGGQRHNRTGNRVVETTSTESAHLRARHYENRWWPETESNCRHGDFQSPALPTELSGHRELLAIMYVACKERRIKAMWRRSVNFLLQELSEQSLQRGLLRDY